MKLLSQNVSLMKLAWWDFHSKDVRFEFISGITGGIPGKIGHEIRKIIWRNYLGGSGPNIAIHKNVIILNPDKLVMGDYARLGIGCYIQAGGEVYIGEHTMLGPYVKIWSQNHRFDDPEILAIEQGYDNKPVHIGSDVWIGADAFIMPGTQIGDRCIVSACSVVGAKHYPENSILAGNPARKIGERPN